MQSKPVMFWFPEDLDLKLSGVGVCLCVSLSSVSGTFHQKPHVFRLLGIPQDMLPIVEHNSYCKFRNISAQPSKLRSVSHQVITHNPIESLNVWIRNWKPPFVVSCPATHQIGASSYLGLSTPIIHTSHLLQFSLSLWSLLWLLTTTVPCWRKGYHWFLRPTPHPPL